MPPMRQPTPAGAEYEWWRRALAGAKQPVYFGDPHAGYFKRRFVRGGPWVAVEIALIRPVGEAGELLAPEYFAAWQDGKEADACEVWLHCCDHPISEKEFRYLTGATRWDRAYAPHHPYANPGRKVDHLTTPLPF